MRIFILEDEVVRHNFFRETMPEHELFIYDNIYEAFNFLQESHENGQWFDLMMFDNDLGLQRRGQGYQLADMLEKSVYNEELPRTEYLIVHSQNASAQDLITTAAKRFAENIVRYPYSNMKDDMDSFKKFIYTISLQGVS